MWMMPLHLHVNQKSDYDYDIYDLNIKLQLFSYPLFKTCVLGAQKNHLIEKILLSTHNICFGSGIRKIIFKYPLLSG